MEYDAFYKNKYGRTEELYECESCEGCQLKNDCCPKASKNRTIRMNRSIQAKGTFGILKWDKSYKRLFRRGEKNVILELTLISCGFNLYKYHNKKQRNKSPA